MRVSIGCGFFQARFPVEDVKEADALEKGKRFDIDLSARFFQILLFKYLQDDVSLQPLDSPVHAAQGCVIRDAPFRNAQGPGNIADRPLEWGSPVTDGLLRLADTNPHGFGYGRAEGESPTTPSLMP